MILCAIIRKVAEWNAGVTLILFAKQLKINRQLELSHHKAFKPKINCPPQSFSLSSQPGSRVKVAIKKRDEHPTA